MRTVKQLTILLVESESSEQVLAFFAHQPMIIGKGHSEQNAITDLIERINDPNISKGGNKDN